LTNRHSVPEPAATGATIRPFRRGDEIAIQQIKLAAIAEGALPTERVDRVPRLAASLLARSDGVLAAEPGGVTR
jgi:hypothetical protein